jgi:hypothetical protein
VCNSNYLHGKDVVILDVSASDDNPYLIALIGTPGNIERHWGINNDDSVLKFIR